MTHVVRDKRSMWISTFAAVGGATVNSVLQLCRNIKGGIKNRIVSAGCHWYVDTKLISELKSRSLVGCINLSDVQIFSSSQQIQAKVVFFTATSLFSYASCFQSVTTEADLVLFLFVLLFFINMHSLNAVAVALIWATFFQSRKTSRNGLTSMSLSRRSDCRAVSRLKSLIRSDWSRLLKSLHSSWSICIVEGQSTVRRHCTV